MKPRSARALWRAGAALAVALLLAGAGGYLLRAHAGQDQPVQPRTQEQEVRAAVVAYLSALAGGDLPALRAATCPGYHDGFFSKVAPAQYRAAHEAQAAAGDLVQLDSVDAVSLAPPAATAHAVVHTKAVPQPRRLSFSLRQTRGKWQVCEPQQARGR